MLLDVGHGTASFSFKVARQAITLGILPHTISSDIYCRNRMNGPVHSLATVMSKFFSVGLTLPQVIACVTENAASALQLSAEGQTAEGEQLLVPLAAVVAGEILLTEQGEASHVFDL